MLSLYSTVAPKIDAYDVGAFGLTIQVLNREKLALISELRDLATASATMNLCRHLDTV